MTTKYSPHPAMEVVGTAAIVLFGYIYAHDNGSTKTIQPALMFLVAVSFWLFMQRIVIADDAIILCRRFGFFKRRIPLAQVSHVDAKMIPVPRGANPTLFIYTTDKRIFRVSLFSHERHIRVAVDIQSRIQRLKETHNTAL